MKNKRPTFRNRVKERQLIANYFKKCLIHRNKNHNKKDNNKIQFLVYNNKVRQPYNFKMLIRM